MPLIHADKISHLSSLQRGRRNKPQAEKKSHLVGKHDLQNAAVQGLTGEQGRTYCRQSGFILKHERNQLLQDFSLKSNSKKITEKPALFLFSHPSLHTHTVDWVQILGQLERGADK